ncbi:hypothetical protein QBC32DRAFT_347828 [Pseudoneurospora amorphoporcata]|uniref:Secreted protein n=1 Tax=Pseudoneurospora amorphoporcata TaxID=241081 RepID=A0AAN6SEA5_9PEZI|nr:hypothetical protein QBC32DRAFT_347828 [Pseudoneurospora amorphoporcata]
MIWAIWYGLSGLSGLSLGRRASCSSSSVSSSCFFLTTSHDDNGFWERGWVGGLIDDIELVIPHTYGMDLFWDLVKGL